jgi:predicted ATP-binding protein involved in virulence
MSAQPDFFAASTLAPNARGFRLDAVELYNWGTFHQHIAVLPCGRANTLLTGDIGAGKSTVVDALTTLLVPHQRITYNRAAGWRPMCAAPTRARKPTKAAAARCRCATNASSASCSHALPMSNSARP